jgi:hypothetical protein
MLASMRSRPKIHLELDPHAAEPGSRLQVMAQLESASETPCDGVTLSFVGTEKRYKRTVRTGNATVRTYHTRTIVELAATASPGTLTVGTHPLSASFELPADDLPPTYSSDHTTIAYEVRAHVSIPWWPDKRTFRPVEVLAPELRVPKEQALRASTHEEPRGAELFMEMTLERARYSPGDVVSGALSLWNGAHHRLKAIELCVVAVETPLVDSSLGPTVVASTPEVAFDPPADGESAPFELDLGEHLTTSFESHFIKVEHFVRARAVIAFGSDVELELPIGIIRPRGEIPKAERTASVGDRRARSAWKKALKELSNEGVTVERADPDEGTMRLCVAGVPVEIAVEQRVGGAVTTATVDHPDLGIGLRLGDRSWTDLGRGLELESPFDDRFRVHARESAQAHAFLTSGLLAALSRAHSVAADDEVVVLSFATVMRTLKSVREVLAAAVEVARQALAASEEVPPPACLGGALGAHRAFASEHRAQLRVGDLSLSGLNVRGVACGLRHLFDGEFAVSSELVVYLPRAASATTARLAELQESLGLRATVDGGALRVGVQTITDPTAALPILERAAATVLAWAGAAASPYRT